MAGECLRVHELVPTDAASVAALVNDLGEQGIDILINNAGASGPAADQQTALSMDFDGWLEAFNVNTLAPMRVLQALHPRLKNGTNAKAITITSQMGALDLNWPTMYAYCSSKAAVNKVMRMMSLDLADDNIAVGLIHPGWVRTDMGGAGADISAAESAAGIIKVIDGINMENTGCFKKWDGETHPW
jgi:NAD(P)-dependent dehydrogenase (short-subunit alcohol dehydrogenase family)